MGLVAPRHVGSCRTRARTQAPLHWQADCQPLRHQGSPLVRLFCFLFSSLGLLVSQEKSPWALWLVFWEQGTRKPRGSRIHCIDWSLISLLSVPFLSSSPSDWMSLSPELLWLSYFQVNVQYLLIMEALKGRKAVRQLDPGSGKKATTLFICKL